MLSLDPCAKGDLRKPISTIHVKAWLIQACLFRVDPQARENTPHYAAPQKQIAWQDWVIVVLPIVPCAIQDIRTTRGIIFCSSPDAEIKTRYASSSRPRAFGYH